MISVTREQLRKVFAFRGLSDDTLQWVLDRSEYKEFEDGEVFVRKNDPIDHMWIMLEGSAPFYMDFSGTQVHYYNFENDEETGGVGGVLPYSRMLVSPGYSHAAGKVKCLLLHKKHFPELEQKDGELTRRLIASMTNRARVFAKLQMQQEKVSALGKLSAGIAHELNNPASAINRISHELTNRLIRNFDLTEKLLFHKVNNEHIHYLRELLKERVSVSPMTSKLTALKRMELEDDTRDWLDNHKIKNAGELSEAFVESGVTIMELERICKMVGEQACGDVLSWMENLVTSQKIINDLDHASSRISGLVTAIKSHVHMDRSGGFQPTDIKEGIENTLTLLGHKLREKKITIERQYDDKIPLIEGNVGELNQVWMNIIDNAIYVLPTGGKLTVKSYVQNNDLKVHITDNGPGIPPEILPRIFDPFFSTKKSGDGTGIGLDIVSRIIKSHAGDIKVSSQPGKTEFIICLPQKQTKK